jgi:hypothetical protein
MFCWQICGARLTKTRMTGKADPCFNYCDLLQHLFCTKTCPAVYMYLSCRVDLDEFKALILEHFDKANLSAFASVSIL